MNIHNLDPQLQAAIVQAATAVVIEVIRESDFKCRNHEVGQTSKEMAKLVGEGVNAILKQIL